MRVAIATSARFHVTDLARELLNNGIDVQYMAYVPKSRAKHYGVPVDKQSNLAPFAAPFLAWGKVAPQKKPHIQQKYLYRALNIGAIARMRPCEFFIGMSGVYLEAGIHARRRFGAKFWLERGSKHILEQAKILSSTPGATPPSKLTIERELEGYRQADKIVVASRHIVDSFLMHDPELAPKLLINPYGVNLDEFPMARRRRPEKDVTIIMVGGWSLRKGCDLLVSAIRARPSIKLIHIGAIVDVPFPENDPQFIHHGPMPQSKLHEHYASADIAVLASREEGLAMVQLQSLATGLPLVTSANTGGADLALTKRLKDNIFEYRQDTVESLGNRIDDAISSIHDGTIPQITEEDRRVLSWKRYGEVYASMLRAEPRTGEGGGGTLAPARVNL